MGNVQSILFNKNLIKLKDAIIWIIEHKFKYTKLDETEKYYRFRQFNPKPYEKKGYKFRIKKLNDMISFVIMYNDKKPDKIFIS